ncbi:MAG: TauD/TfdA family dioxygenase [Cyanobacteria bacterium P01_H01_bin.58]
MSIPIVATTQFSVDNAQNSATSVRDVARSILTALSTYPYYLVVDGYSPNLDKSNLLALAEAIRLEGNAAAGQTSKDAQPKISFTKVRINPNKANAAKNVTQYSRTHLPLPPHTDSSYMSRPHEVVAFQCIVPDTSGGESILIPIADLIQRLDSETIKHLQEPVYPFGSHHYPILTGTSGSACIRYYQAQIERTRSVGKKDSSPLPQRCLAALDTLDTVLAQTEQFSPFKLKAGQIAFMHNHKVLHGRRGFVPDSDRLLYRIRLHVDALAVLNPPHTPAEASDSLSVSMSDPTLPFLKLTPQVQAPIAFSPVSHNPEGDLRRADMHANLQLKAKPKCDRQSEPPTSLSDWEQAQVQLAKARELYALEQLEEALSHCRHASQLAGDNVELLYVCGKFFLRAGKFDEATHILRRCLAVEPTHYDSSLVLSSLMNKAKQKQEAQTILRQAVQHHPYVWNQPFDPAKKTILRTRGIDESAYKIIRRKNGSYKHVLRGGHFSIRNLVEKQDYNLAIFNVLNETVDTLTDLPQADLIINTIACPDLKRLSLLATARLVDRYPQVPVINNPRRVLKTTREHNALRLNIIPGVTFPRTERLFWDGTSVEAVVKEIAALGFKFPIIIREVGSQTGKSTAFLKDEASLRSHFQNSKADQYYYVIQFQDCRNSQGIFNKTRMFFVDSTLYPVANLFHDSWNVHSGDRYQIMDKQEWTQEQEKLFLKDPASYLGQANIEKLYRIRDIVDLDFFGLDFTVLEDGTLFIFELNAAMRHNFDHTGNFPYTRPYLEEISYAFNRMIQSRLERQ